MTFANWVAGRTEATVYMVELIESRIELDCYKDRYTGIKKEMLLVYFDKLRELKEKQI